MFSKISALSLATAIGCGAAATVEQRQAQPAPVSSTTCNGKTYTYNQLAGFGYLPSDAVDKFNDTIGGIGSSVAFERLSWRRSGNSYTGTVWGLPDRGWNTEGTLNQQNRVHRFQLTLTPNNTATAANPSPHNIQLKYEDTVLFTDPLFAPVSGLDANQAGAAHYPGFPDIPVSDYTGDGFGGPGPGGRTVSLDSEGLVLTADGGFWVSDEYGPYVYRFSRAGNLVQAIRPPDALIPIRNGSESFSSDNPPRYDPTKAPIPANPTSGRVNNHGFEGLTSSPDGRYLYTLLQGAAIQEGGSKAATERYVRFLQYDTLRPSGPTGTPSLIAEYVVALPNYVRANGAARTADQSEVHFVSPTQFLVLARDSGAGHGQSSSTSIYRHADVFDISNATNIIGQYDATNQSIASTNGVLKPGITPAAYCPFVDYNINSQLNRYMAHNGGAQDQNLLNEKWESLALVPVDGGIGADGRWFLISFSDNDFITQRGQLKGGQFHYSDSSGFNLDNQILAFEITLPTGSSPLYG